MSGYINTSRRAASTCIMHASSITRRALLQIKDCNVVASKLILILDDLLWVLTDSQLKAMVQYAKSLSEAMEKSAQQRKSLATEEQVRVSNACHAATFTNFTPLSMFVLLLITSIPVPAFNSPYVSGTIVSVISACEPCMHPRVMLVSLTSIQMVPV